MRRVIKIGGSLMERLLCDCTPLSVWLTAQTPATNLIITGGGVWADAVRELYRRGATTDESAHWLAIRAMQLTSSLLGALQPTWQTDPGWMSHLDCGSCRTAEGRVHDALHNANYLLDPHQFMREIEPQAPGERLIVGWQVTSDSIAARLAEVIDADELVLLKSCRPADRVFSHDLATTSSGYNWQHLASVGYVDEWFPRAASRVRSIRIETL